MEDAENEACKENAVNCPPPVAVANPIGKYTLVIACVSLNPSGK